jgi:hypothetical protein
MDAGTILLALAVVCFVHDAYNAAIGSLAPKWWANGVAFYLAVGLIK